MKPIPASYESECPLCMDRIVEGEEIVTVDGEWVHADCAEDNEYEVERDDGD
jgi:hypothetical protein